MRKEGKRRRTVGDGAHRATDSVGDTQRGREGTEMLTGSQGAPGGEIQWRGGEGGPGSGNER